jgi:pimeloyl-ACP methyl ester carboxylesterase
MVPLPLPLLGVLARDLLRTLELDEVDVIGLSWGGLLAQQLAVLAPKRVRRMVLASTNVGTGSFPGGWRAIRTLATPARYSSADQLHAALRVFGLDPDCVGDAVRVHNEARFARPPTARGYYGQILGLLGWSSLPLLPLIRQPTLVICGDADPAVPLANGRLLAKFLPDAQLHVLPGGHLVLFEQLMNSVDLLARFLNSVLVSADSVGDSNQGQEVAHGDADGDHRLYPPWPSRPLNRRVVRLTRPPPRQIRR